MITVAREKKEQVPPKFQKLKRRREDEQLRLLLKYNVPKDTPGRASKMRRFTVPEICLRVRESYPVEVA